MMRITLFGTRGSIPAPGPETARYGGNTPSVEVRGDDGTVLVLDAGTGVRRLGTQLPPDLTRIDVLLTHLHMDHIQGLGFFGPLYHPGIQVHIWGPASSTMPLDARLSRYLSPPLSSIPTRPSASASKRRAGLPPTCQIMSPRSASRTAVGSSRKGSRATTSRTAPIS